MISPYRISWSGLSSLDFDCWTELSFDSDSGNTSTFLNRENIITEHYDGRRTIHRTKYQEVLTPTITFIKQNYGDFDAAENRKILSWLTSSDKPGWLEIYHDDSNVLSYKLWGNWTEIEQYKLANGRVVGYVASFESSYPTAYSRLFTYPSNPDSLEQIADYLQVSGINTFSITCGTDEYNKVIYPTVTINFNSTNAYIPIDRNPTEDSYEMMHNVIYRNQNTNKYYVNVPSCNYKGEVSGIFSTDINSQRVNSSMIDNYYYCSIDRILYKGIVIYKPATTFTEGITYYSDTNGTVAKIQPTNDSEVTNEEYYVVSTNDDGTPVYGWEAVANIGIGIQIENSYRLNGEDCHSKTVITGNIPKEQIVLDGTNKVVSSSLTPMRIIGDDFNWIWIPIAEGTNNITITGNCGVRFEWIEPRKVGSL